MKNMLCKQARVFCIHISMAAACCFNTQAATMPSLKLKAQPDFAKNINNFPLPAENNAVLDKIRKDIILNDKTFKESLLSCREESGTGADNWFRNISVTMAGPRYLSYVVFENSTCEWAPEFEYNQYSLVYDLKTGERVDWFAVLPKNLIGNKPQNYKTTDRSIRSTQSTLKILALFKTQYIKQMDDTENECCDCLNIRTNYWNKQSKKIAPFSFLLWLNAKEHSLTLVLQDNLPTHEMRECGTASVNVTLNMLKQNGVSRDFLNTLKNATAVPEKFRNAAAD